MKQVIFSALKFTAILSLAAFARMPAAAEAGTDEMGFHFGAGPAFVKVGDYCEGASAARASCDDSAIGFKVFGNYRFTETFGVEGGYMRARGFDVILPETDDMGNPVTYYINNINTLPIGPVYDSTASAFYIAGEAAHALEGGFRVFAKAGLNFWKHEAHFSTGSDHTDGTDPLFGAGVEYRRAPTSPFKFRAEWLRLLQEDSGRDRDTDVISLSAGYSF